MYTKLAWDADYRRRITYIDGIPLYVAEYLGTFPRATEAHGNATKLTREYVQTRPAVLEADVDDIKATKDKLRKVYERQHLDSYDDGLRNMKQVTNAAKQVCDGLQTKSSGNLADEMQSLGDFRNKQFTPCTKSCPSLDMRVNSVVLFTQEQIDDIRMFCCGGAPTNLRCPSRRPHL